MEKYKNKLYWLTCTLLFLLSTAALASNHSLNTSVYIQNNLVVAQDAEMILMAKKVAPSKKKSNSKAKRNSARAVGKAKIKRSGIKTVSKFKQKIKEALSKNKLKGIKQAKYKKSRLGKNNRPLSQKRVNPKKAVTNSFIPIKKKTSAKSLTKPLGNKGSLPKYLQKKAKISKLGDVRRNVNALRLSLFREHIYKGEKKGIKEKPIDHIMRRHAFSSLSKESKFLEGVSKNHVQKKILTAIKKGHLTENGPNGIKVSHDFGKKKIGYTKKGEKTSRMEVYIRDGQIRTAYPVN